MKRPAHCGSGHPDGYLCELAPSHAGEHRAFIDAHDEQGKIPELSWPAAALPGAEAEASATAFPDDAEWLVYLDRFVEQTNPQSLPRSIHDRLRAIAAALTSEVARLTERERVRASALIHATNENARLTSEVRALTEQREMLAKRARQQITRLRYRLNDEDMSSGLRAGLIQQIEDWRDALAARLASPSPTGAT